MRKEKTNSITEILKMIIQTIKDGAMWIDPLAVPILRDKNCGIVIGLLLQGIIVKDVYCHGCGYGNEDNAHPPHIGNTEGTIQQGCPHKGD